MQIMFTTHPPGEARYITHIERQNLYDIFLYLISTIFKIFQYSAWSYFLVLFIILFQKNRLQYIYIFILDSISSFGFIYEFGLK